MQFDLTDEQRSVQHLAREFAANEVAPRAQKIDQSDQFDWNMHRKLGELGFICMTVPQHLGGGGFDTVSWCIAIEEIAKASLSVSNGLTLTESTGHYISTLGNSAQQEAILPSVIRGDAICAFALTEPNAGSDAASITTTARAEQDQYVINGQKMFTSGAHLADHFIVVATLDRELGAKGIRAFLVSGKAPGLTRGKPLDLLGARAMGTAPLFLDDCRVPSGNLLGSGTDGFAQVMKGLDGAGRLGAACQAIGIAQAAFEASLTYANDRRQFSKPIIEFQAIQFMLADMSAEIDAARLLTLKAAWLRDQGRNFTKESSHAKMFSSDMCVRHVSNAMQIFGGYSYTKDLPLERYYRDAKIHQIWDGTNQIQRIIIGRHLKRGV